MTANAPIVVIGAHRSGTSALVDVLAALGVFPGARLDPNRESWLFLRLNEWLLRQCGGRWDHPAAVDDLVSDPELRALAADCLRLAVDGPRSAAHLGWTRYLRGRRIRGLREPWLFKDPRTTFTLPLWLDVFGGAKVVHLHRHGADVAASLHARQARSASRSRARYARNRPLLGWLAKGAGFTDSPRCRTPEGAFSLWEEYVARARRHVASFGAGALELRFEDLLEHPREVVERLCAWAGLDATEASRARAAGLLDRGRSRAFERDRAWSAFAARVAERVEALRAPAACTEPERSEPAAPRGPDPAFATPGGGERHG